MIYSLHETENVCDVSEDNCINRKVKKKSEKVKIKEFFCSQLNEVKRENMTLEMNDRTLLYKVRCAVSTKAAHP